MGIRLFKGEDWACEVQILTMQLLLLQWSFVFLLIFLFQMRLLKIVCKLP